MSNWNITVEPAWNYAGAEVWTWAAGEIQDYSISDPHDHSSDNTYLTADINLGSQEEAFAAAKQAIKDELERRKKVATQTFNPEDES